MTINLKWGKMVNINFEAKKYAYENNINNNIIEYQILPKLQSHW